MELFSRQKLVLKLVIVGFISSLALDENTLDNYIADFYRPGVHPDTKLTLSVL